MKDKIINFVFIIISILLLVGLFTLVAISDSNTSSNTNQQEEKPVLYWKDIDVKVVSNNKHSWFVKTRFYKQEIKVVSDEYNLEETFYLTDSGAFANMPYWNIKEGDIIKAELYSWKLESTGEIVNREINKLK
nr:MAG TPA: hypothetical protein [Caudoviricetes sp.]